MEMAYIQAENLKHKRTFTKTLIVLAPFVTALMNFFAPLWFQLNSYNWWYILLYPGFLTLTCALIEQRDNGKLKYRAVASLPVSQNKVWKAKIGVAGIYSCVGNFIFLALNLLRLQPRHGAKAGKQESHPGLCAAEGGAQGNENADRRPTERLLSGSQRQRRV